MSYDISIVDPATKETITVSGKHDLKGGTYALDGCNELWLNVTYNYSQHFYRVLGEKGIREIYGMKAKDAAILLRGAAAKLHGEPAHDYWEPCEGNAKKALENLALLADMAPDGIFEGD